MEKDTQDERLEAGCSFADEAVITKCNKGLKKKKNCPEQYNPPGTAQGEERESRGQ